MGRKVYDCVWQENTYIHTYIHVWRGEGHTKMCIYNVYTCLHIHTRSIYVCIHVAYMCVCKRERRETKNCNFDDEEQCMKKKGDGLIDVYLLCHAVERHNDTQRVKGREGRKR